MERGHRGAPGWSQSGDTSAIVRPGEVFTPHLVAGIEETCKRSCHRVLGSNLVAFVFIAKGTGQPEIVFLTRPTQRLRDDVINLHGRADDIFGREAVTTAVLGLRRDVCAQRFRDVCPAHGSRTLTSRPRCLSRSAARARKSMMRSYRATSAVRVCVSRSIRPSR